MATITCVWVLAPDLSAATLVLSEANSRARRQYLLVKFTPPAIVLCLVPAVMLLSAGCDTLECQDGGRLEEAYNDGERIARLQNEQNFERGRLEGLGLTRQDGEDEGYQAGWQDGYDSGFGNDADYEAGYYEGYDLGLDLGLGDSDACASGDDAGYAEGWQFGDADGYEVGYQVGYSDWYRPCGVASDVNPSKSHEEQSADPEEIGQCHSRGMRSARDSGAFGRGRRAGAAQNPEYQAGYQEQYELGLAGGQLEGEAAAYEEGYVLGYAAGFDEGYLLSWYDCYDRAYSEGYDAGYDEGHRAGYEEGSYDGDYDSC